MRRLTRCGCLALVVSVWAMLGGCVLGPSALKVSRVRYNEAIQATTSEQLLLNLVRLKYREPPLFLEVGSVSAQFVFKESADARGTINEGPHSTNPDVLGLSAGVGFEERPTVTFTPLQGGDFVNQLLSPLKLEVLVLLARSGWSVDRVLRIGVQSMNGLDNAASASGPTPETAPCYEAFAQALGLFRDVQKKGLLELGYEARTVFASPPVPLEGLSLSDMAEAMTGGYTVQVADDGRSVALARESRVLVWRVSPSARQHVEVAQLIELLGLKPDCPAYEIRATAGGHPPPDMLAGERTKVDVATRSLMGALFYLSQAVEVPEKHRDRGLVTTTTTADGQPFDWGQVVDGLLRVRSRSARPSDAAVAVRHQGCWYYIDEADLTSKSTFGLLTQLFALQAGEVETAVPVLTLPVGG